MTALADRFSITTTTHNGTEVTWRSARLTQEEIRTARVLGEPYDGGVVLRPVEVEGVTCFGWLSWPSRRLGEGPRLGHVVYPSVTDAVVARDWSLDSDEAAEEQRIAAEAADRARYGL